MVVLPKSNCCVSGPFVGAMLTASPSVKEHTSNVIKKQKLVPYLSSSFSFYFFAYIVENKVQKGKSNVFASISHNSEATLAQWFNYHRSCISQQEVYLLFTGRGGVCICGLCASTRCRVCVFIVGRESASLCLLCSVVFMHDSHTANIQRTTQHGGLNWRESSCQEYSSCIADTFQTENNRPII